MNNDTGKIIITDAKGSVTYSPEPQVKLPEDWLRALEFTKKVKEELKGGSNLEDFPALVGLITHLLS